MLASLLALSLHAAPAFVTDQSHPPAAEQTDLRFFAAALGGLSLLQLEPPPASRGLVTGMRVGLHATRPPFVLGAARFGVLPTLALRHDFGSARTEWSGVVNVSMTLWRLLVLMGVGYGLSMRGEEVPGHLVEIDLSLSLRVGPLLLGVGFDTCLRPGSSSRTMQLLGTVGFELELQREAFPRS